VEFGPTLRSARKAAGLTQEALARRVGTARPNIPAYEHGRREPRFDTAVALLEAAGADLHIDEPVGWSWTSGRRPYAVPLRLWRLSVADALRVLELGLHLWWSGPPRRFDLADRRERMRAYEIVLREGTPVDIEAIVDGLLLCECWDELVLPAELRHAWTPVLTTASGPHDRRRAS